MSERDQRQDQDRNVRGDVTIGTLDGPQVFPGITPSSRERVITAFEQSLKWAQESYQEVPATLGRRAQRPGRRAT